MNNRRYEDIRGNEKHRPLPAYFSLAWLLKGIGDIIWLVLFVVIFGVLFNATMDLFQNLVVVIR